MKIVLLALVTVYAFSAMPVVAATDFHPAQSHQVTPQERAAWQARHAANHSTNNNRGNYGNNNNGSNGNGNNRGNYNNSNNGSNNRGSYGNNGNGNGNNNGNGNGNNNNGNPSLVNRILQQTQPNGNK